MSIFDRLGKQRVQVHWAGAHQNQYDFGDQIVGHWGENDIPEPLSDGVYVGYAENGFRGSNVGFVVVKDSKVVYEGTAVLDAWEGILISNKELEKLVDEL